MYTYDLKFDDYEQMDKVSAPKFDFVNVRYAIHNSIFSPYSIPNDGMYEIQLMRKPYDSFGQYISEFKEMQMGGLQVHNFENYRFSKVRLTNQNHDETGALKIQNVIVDGEPFPFKEYLDMKVLKQDVELIVDLDSLYEDYANAVRKPIAPQLPKKKSYGCLKCLCFLFMVVALVLVLVFREDIFGAGEAAEVEPDSN